MFFDRLVKMGDLMKDYNVGDLVSEFLHQIDVKDVFGVLSHNIPMLMQLVEEIILE